MCIWYYCLSPPPCQFFSSSFFSSFVWVLIALRSQAINSHVCHPPLARSKTENVQNKKKGLDTYHFSVNSQLGQSTMRCIFFFLSSACLIDSYRWPRRRHILIGKSNSSSENRPWYSENGAYLSNSGSSRATQKLMSKLHVYLLVVLTCRP